MPEDKLPIPQFAAKIKAKYPEYKDINDTLLVQKILDKYPEYNDQVDMSGLQQPQVKKKDWVSSVFGGGSKPTGQPTTSTPNGLVGSEKKNVIDYMQGLKTAEQKSYSKPTLKRENAIVAVDTKQPYSEEKIDKAARTKIDETMYDDGDDWKDPLKGVYKKVASSTPIPTAIDLLIQDRATKIIEDNLMPDGFEAVRILGDSHFGNADDKNLTANKIKARADSYLKATQPFRELVFENAMAEGGIVDDPMADYNSKEKFYDAAIKAYAEKNPNFKSQLQVAGGINIEDNAKRGQVIEQMINDPDFITYATKENPKLLPLVDQVQSDLYKDNKDYGVNQVANKVSREIQKTGYNNIDPVFNFAGEGAKEMADITAKSVLTPEEYQIYQENNVFEKLDMPSFFEGFASSGKGIGEGIVNTFKQPFMSTPEVIKKGWDKEASNVSADPEGLSKFLRDSGHAMGFVATLGATGNVGGLAGLGTNAANLTSLGVVFLGDNLEQARMKYPDSPVKQWTSALTNTALYMAMGKSIFPAAKVEQAFAKVQPAVSNTIENLASGKISKEIAREKLNTIGKQAIDMASVGLQKNLKVSAEMTGITILNKGLDKILGMDDQSFEKYHPEGEGSDTFKSMFLSNIIVNGLAARGQIKSKNNMAKESIYEAATNPQRYRRIIEGAEIKGDINSAKELLDNLDYVTTIKKELDTRQLTEKQKKDYLFNAIKSKVLNASKPQSPDATLTRKHSERVKELEEINQGILEGKDADEVITTTEQKAIDELQKVKDEGEKATIEIESLTKNQELDNKEIDAKIKALDKESATYGVQKEKLEQQRKEKDANYESKINKLTKPSLIAQAIEAIDKDLPEYLREGAKADVETMLREAAEQLNSTPGEAKTARSMYGNTISDIALKLFPDAKTKIDHNSDLAKMNKELEELDQPIPSEEISSGEVLQTVKIGEFEKDEMLSMIDNRKDTVEDDPESSFGIEAEEGALDNLKQKIESGDNNFTKGELEWLKSEADDLLEKTQGAIESDGNPEAKKRLPKIKKFVNDINEALSKPQSPSSSNTPKEGLNTKEQEGSGVEKKETAQSRAKKVYKDIGEVDDPSDARGTALAYLAGGGKIGEQSFNGEVAGKVQGASLNTGAKEKKSSEVKARDYVTKDGKSIDDIAHSIWEGLPDNLRETVTTQDIRNELIDVANSHNTRLSAAIEFRDRYITDNAKNQLTEAEAKQIEDAELEQLQKIVDELPENQQQELIYLFKKYQNKYGIIDWEALEKDTNGFSPDILSLPIDTQNALDGIVNKNIKSGQGEYNSTSRQDSSQKEGNQKAVDETAIPKSNQENKQANKSSKEAIITDEVIDESGKGAGKEPPTGEAVVGEGEIGNGGITHAANEVRRQDRLLPEYEKTPQTFEQWNNEAEKAVKDGYDVEKLISEIEKGHDPTPVENAIRKIYVATLDAEIAKNPTDALLAKQKRFIEAGDLANSRAGRNLVSLKGEGSPLSSISDFYVAKMEAAGVDKLTDQQKKETKEAFDNVQKADANATAAMEAYREEIAKLKAENELLREKKGGTSKPKEKKTHDDYVKERDTYREELKKAKEKHEKWLKDNNIQRQGFGFSLTTDMAKAIAKIVKSHVEENVTKLEDVIKKVLEDIKDFLPDVTEKDIRDVIAGEYNEKRPTRNELAAKMRDLKDEAYYINKLERLLKGEEPKSERKRVARNREITELQQKIKDFQKAERDAAKPPKEIVDADLSKLSAIKKRNEQQEKEIRERISKGDFEKEKKKPFLEDPEMQKKFPKQYNAALDAIKKKEDARHEFDIALLRDEMSKRTLAQKATDNLSKAVGTVKAITTGIDDSAVAIQTYMSMLVRPRTGATAFYQHIRQGFSQKKFDRWLTALHSSADFKEMKDMGLDVTEPSSLKEREKEEIFNNRFDGTIKVKGKEYKLIGAPLKPFERAFTTLGNVTRVVGYRTISAKYKREGYTIEKNPELFKSLATRLNTETGRGKVNEYVDMANKVVTMGIWSPKLMAMKFNLLGVSDLASIAMSKAGTKGYYRQLHPKERIAAIKDVAQFALTVMALSYGFALANGGDIDDDPLSSTFMDVKLPNGKSYNFTGGFSGYIRAICQFAAGKKHKDGKTINVGRLETGGRFFRGKTPPITGAVLNLASGKDFMGRPTTVLDQVVNLSPISLHGIVSQIQADGGGAFFTQGIPTFFGFNVKNENDYPKNSGKPERPKADKPDKPDKPEK